MHPATSVIIFTSLSGLGFGMMFFLGLGMPDVHGWVAFIFVAIAYVLAGGGLISSTFHLGHPERAWRAFSQWKTSWLAREGVLAVLTMGVFGIYALLWIFMDNRIEWLGYIGAALAIITVYSTSMIYAQMKTIPRWNTPMTSVLYLMYSLAGGSLLASKMEWAGYMFAALVVVQVVAWMMGDKAFAKAGHTIGTATGLANLGQVRLVEKPHSGTNYLMTEMVHVIGRKHGMKLRVIALVLGLIVPAALLLLMPFNHPMALVALLTHLVGLFAQRWLFFAEAEHVVGLYYGKQY